jgi:hypothetical protein
MGFYDHKTNAGAWSDDMELVLENGAPVANLVEEEPIVVPDEYDVDQGNYSAQYNFDAVGDLQCGGNPKCEGWEVNGYYKIETSVFGKSKVRIVVNAKSPQNLDLFSMFGIVIGIETDAQTTETFLVYNNPNSMGFTWTTANYDNSISITESRDNPFNGYDDNRPTTPW